MSGHFDFGNDRDMPGGSVGDNVADLILRIKTTIFPAVSVVAPGADFSQFGIFFDLDPPALVLCQVPMECVELMKRHEIEKPFDIGDVAEMPADIQHQSAP